MKKIIKTSVSLACVLAMMLSLLCIAPMTASAIFEVKSLPVMPNLRPSRMARRMRRRST